MGSKAAPSDSEAGEKLSLAAASFKTGQGEIRLELRLLGRGEGGKVLPLKAAQQEWAADGVFAVIGIGAVGRQTHVLPLAVADEHHPLGQVTAHLDGPAHDLLKRLQGVLHSGGAGFLSRCEFSERRRNVDRWGFIREKRRENPKNALISRYSMQYKREIVKEIVTL